MSKKIGIVVGNGFSIDLLHKINKLEEIDVSNLFKKGAKVKWPANDEPGFLSSKYCPNLWRLGARPNLDNKDSYRIIEEIITVINVYATLPTETIRKKSSSNDVGNIYIYAYKELTSYLRQLFIFYNSLISDDEIDNLDWSWKNFFHKLDATPEIESVEIINYNYDLFLERTLNALNIDFSTIGIDTEPYQKFKIYKPHGSIGFIPKASMPKDNFNITKSLDILNGSLSELECRHGNLDAFMPFIPIIPPAGEAHRYAQSWASVIRGKVRETISSFSNRDEFFMCGISYWHVDRAEIDEIIIGLDSGINFRMINPGNVDHLSAVLGMAFENYIHYSSSSVLGDLI